MNTRMRNVWKGLVVAVVLFLSAGLVNAQQKIGHINYADIFMATPEYKKAEQELRVLDSTKTNELQGMVGVFQQKQNEGQELLRNRSEANKDETDQKIQQLSMEVQDIQRRLDEVQRIAEEELGKKQQELFAPIRQRVDTAIQALAKEKGYAYVFDISSTNIPFFQGGDDLSQDVKTKLGIN